jgi:hypothetical protein
MSSFSEFKKRLDYIKTLSGDVRHKVYSQINSKHFWSYVKQTV